MKVRNLNKPKMKWEEMSVLDMKFGNEEFDFVLDKGTMDDIMCGENSFLNVALMLKEI